MRPSVSCVAQDRLEFFTLHRLDLHRSSRESPLGIRAFLVGIVLAKSRIPLIFFLHFSIDNRLDKISLTRASIPCSELALIYILT